MPRFKFAKHSEHYHSKSTKHRTHKFHPIRLDELMHMSLFEDNGYVGTQIVLGLIKNQYL